MLFFFVVVSEQKVEVGKEKKLRGGKIRVEGRAEQSLVRLGTTLGTFTCTYTLEASTLP